MHVANTTSSGTSDKDEFEFDMLLPLLLSEVSGACHRSSLSHCSQAHLPTGLSVIRLHRHSHLFLTGSQIADSWFAFFGRVMPTLMQQVLMNSRIRLTGVGVRGQHVTPGPYRFDCSNYHVRSFCTMGSLHVTENAFRMTIRSSRQIVCWP